MAREQMMESWAKEHRAQLLRIVEANVDFPERAHRLGIASAYEPEDDTWFMTLGDPVEALTETVDDTLLLRVEPETLKIVGIEVIGLKRFLEESPNHVTMFLNFAEAAMANRRSSGNELPGSSVTADLRALALA